LCCCDHNNRFIVISARYQIGDELRDSNGIYHDWQADRVRSKKRLDHNLCGKITLYFQANKIADSKQIAVFLSTIGAKTYALLRNLVTLSLPKDKSFV